MKKIGVLTSGGDAPGMNACIRSVVKSALSNQMEVEGILDGFQGLIENRFVSLDAGKVDNCIQFGGTMLGSSRSDAFKTIEGRRLAYKNSQLHAIDGLVLIGGDGTFVGGTLFNKETGIPIIGVPGTIDNDISGTDHTIGYDTCLNTVINAVDKIRDTASNHHRIFFVEVMGKNSGLIALNVALAAGAESVLIPEEVTNLKEITDQLLTQNKGKRSSIIIVAEGDDAGGAKQVVDSITPYLSGYDIKYTVLGHVQRGGSPSAFDRILASQLGDYAVRLLKEGKTNAMVGIKGGKLISQNIGEGTFSPVSIDTDRLMLLDRMLTR